MHSAVKSEAKADWSSPSSAGWNFDVFGLLHGFYICVNEAWRHLLGKETHKALAASRIARYSGWLLTTLAVIWADVLFRAPSFSAAGRVYAAMLGFGDVATVKYLSFTPLAAGAIVLLGAIVWFLPNSMELTWRFRPAIPPARGASPISGSSLFAWQPSRRAAAAIALLYFFSILSISSLRPFIYFQF